MSVRYIKTLRNWFLWMKWNQQVLYFHILINYSQKCKIQFFAYFGLDAIMILLSSSIDSLPLCRIGKLTIWNYQCHCRFISQMMVMHNDYIDLWSSPKVAELNNIFILAQCWQRSYSLFRNEEKYVVRI